MQTKSTIPQTERMLQLEDWIWCEVKPHSIHNPEPGLHRTETLYHRYIDPKAYLSHARTAAKDLNARISEQWILKLVKRHEFSDTCVQLKSQASITGTSSTVCDSVTYHRRKSSTCQVQIATNSRIEEASTYWRCRHNRPCSKAPHRLDARICTGIWSEISY